MILISSRRVKYDENCDGVENLYEELMRIPESFLLSPKMALIVPAFEFLPKLKVSPQSFSESMSAYLPSLPTTKEKLALCMLSSTKNCTVFRDKSHLHVSFVLPVFSVGVHYRRMVYITILSLIPHSLFAWRSARTVWLYDDCHL